MYLNVGYQSQWDFGDTVKTDPTGCWYASACMVAHSFSQGPRKGVPELYCMDTYYKDGSVGKGHWALPPDWLSTFMQNENLVFVPGGFPSTISEIDNLLSKWGPLFLTWQKTNKNGQNYGHCSVIIGTVGDNVIIHDPENEPNTPYPIATLKACADQWPHYGPIMKQDLPAHSFKGGTLTVNI